MATANFEDPNRARDMYAKHLAAIKKAKPRLDTSDPTDERFLLRVKRKRQLYEDEYQYRVDRQNEALLERLVRIRGTRGKIDNWNPKYQPKFDKNKAYRKRMRDKIDVENKQILKRLNNSKSQYNRADWDKSFAKHQRYLAILQKRRKPWQARSYRELGGAFIMNSPRKKRKLSKTEETEDESEGDEDSLTEDDSDDDYSEKSSDDEKKSGMFPEIKVLLFLTDKISEHNYKAVGSKNAEKSARLKANSLRNKCQEAMRSCGMQSAEYVNWSRDIETSDAYISALKYVKHLYQVNDQFRNDIQECTQIALVSLKNGREKGMPEKSRNTAIDLEEGVQYPLKELAFFSVVCDIYERCEKYVLVYQRPWRVLERYFEGKYDNVTRPCLGFYVLE